MNLTFKILILGFLILTACQGKKKKDALEQQQATQTNALDDELNTYNDLNILPGFAVSICTSDSILYQKGFGMADIHSKTPFRPDNIQLIASVTKTLVGIALMKTVEDGLLELDDDINKFLPYKVVNPDFPQEKITLRMLASHTSSIAGTKKSDKGYRFESPLLASEFPEAYKPLLNIYNKTETISMSDFIENKLSSAGKWYDEELFTDKKPGTSYEYSNIGITLLAQIIENNTHQSFDEYTKDLILRPLSMNSSYWKLENVPSGKQVRYYNELKNEVPNYYIITYPDGGLYSSVSDMTSFLREVMKGYEGKSKLLSKETFREMMRKQFSGEELNDGICWDLSYEGLIGHSGNDFGTATLMYFSPESGIGRILFTNISIETEEQEEAFYGIFNTLFDYNFEM